MKSNYRDVGIVLPARDGWMVVVLLRPSPVVPLNLQTYALGVTGIPFLQYLGAPLVGIIPGLAIYVYFAMFGEHLRAGPVGQLSGFLFAVGAL